MEEIRKDGFYGLDQCANDLSLLIGCPREHIQLVLGSMQTHFPHLNSHLLPQIFKLASMVSGNQLLKRYRVLESGTETLLMIDRSDIACILSALFLCHNSLTTTPDINNGLDTQHFNILSWWSSAVKHRQQKDSTNCTSFQKLLCLLQYFNQTSNSTGGIGDPVTIHRRVSKSAPDWRNVTNRINVRNCQVFDEGLIEDSPSDYLRVDFANEYIGGGVLRHGCVQEEILFVIYPEMLISMLFCGEKMNDSESIWITNVQRHSEYTGYGRSFKYAGPSQISSSNTSLQTFIAIDALYFDRGGGGGRDCFIEQMKYGNIERELNKLYCGFSRSAAIDRRVDLKVATGNWGCGAFNGDPQLKAVLQLIAFSLAAETYSGNDNNSLRYYTFKDYRLRSKDGFSDLRGIYALLQGVEVKLVIRMLEEFADAAPAPGELFPFIQTRIVK